MNSDSPHSQYVLPVDVPCKQHACQGPHYCDALSVQPFHGSIMGDRPQTKKSTDAKTDVVVFSGFEMQGQGQEEGQGLGQGVLCKTLKMLRILWGIQMCMQSMKKLSDP